MLKINNPDLSAEAKDKLIQRALERKQHKLSFGNEVDVSIAVPETIKQQISEEHYRFDLHPGYTQLRIVNDGAKMMGIKSPFFKLHEGSAGATTRIANKEYINYASYNYLGFSGHPAVTQAAIDAINIYGTSVSASRLVSGERPIHRQLEQEIASAYNVDDAIVFVSGHATNVTTIGYLFGHKDLILHDELIHNSALQGSILSGARRLSFPHNDWRVLDAILTEQRHQFERVLIVVEGIYSMDGDYPELPKFIEIKQKHHAFLMVDDAHSFGVMGAKGLGIREHFHLDGKDVDIWMGTLSKSLAGCGGYIAGETALIEHLKFLAPGFLYSVGMSPPLAAASLTALQHLHKEPERVKSLQERGHQFIKLAKAAKIDIGNSSGLAVIPAITGSSIKAAQLSAAMFEHGINVQPILYPAVSEKSARLRFFISSQHTEKQINDTVQVLAAELARLA